MAALSVVLAEVAPRSICALLARLASPRELANAVPISPKTTADEPLLLAVENAPDGASADRSAVGRRVRSRPRGEPEAPRTVAEKRDNSVTTRRELRGFKRR